MLNKSLLNHSRPIRTSQQYQHHRAWSIYYCPATLQGEGGGGWRQEPAVERWRRGQLQLGGRCCRRAAAGKTTRFVNGKFIIFPMGRSSFSMTIDSTSFLTVLLHLVNCFIFSMIRVSASFSFYFILFFLLSSKNEQIDEDTIPYHASKRWRLNHQHHSFYYKFLGCKHVITVWWKNCCILGKWH